MKRRILPIGWKTKVMLRGFTYSVTINKAVAIGSALQNGDEIYCYLAEDEKKRPIIIVYLDGKQKEK